MMDNYEKFLTDGLSMIERNLGRKDIDEGNRNVMRAQKIVWKNCLDEYKTQKEALFDEVKRNARNNEKAKFLSRLKEELNEVIGKMAGI